MIKNLISLILNIINKIYNLTKNLHHRNINFSALPDFEYLGTVIRNWKMERIYQFIEFHESLNNGFAMDESSQLPFALYLPQFPLTSMGTGYLRRNICLKKNIKLDHYKNFFAVLSKEENERVTY